MPAPSKITMTRLAWPERAAYGAGDYGLNFFWQGAGFYLFFYYTDVLHLSAGLAGTLFAIGGLWDAFSDPIMGYFAERTRSRFGRYRPYLLWGAPMLSLAFIMTFAPPLLDEPFWVAGQALFSLLLFRTAYTVVSIPYSSLSARLVSDGQERTKLAGVRMYFGFLGGVSMAALAGWLRMRFDDEIAFPVLALLCGILALVALMVCFFFTEERSKVATVGEPAPSLKTMTTALLQNRPLILLFFAIVAVTVATSFITKTVLYVFQYGLGSAEAGDKSLFIFTAAPLLTIPLWSAIALRMGKRRAWWLACLITASGLAALYLDDWSSVFATWGAYGLTTLGLSAFGLLFWSMLPNTVEYGFAQTGIRNEAVIFGLASSSQKAALAASAFFLGQLLEFIGYRPDVAQSAETLNGLRLLSSVIPLGAIIIAGLIMAFYPLTRQYHATLVERMRATAAAE